MKITRCKDCGVQIVLYNPLNRRCVDCTKKNFKPIAQVGKKTIEWLEQREIWLQEDCIDSKYWQCEKCPRKIYNRHDVEYHHVQKRSLAPELRLERANVMRLCPYCHEELNNSKVMWSKKNE